MYRFKNLFVVGLVAAISPACHSSTESQREAARPESDHILLELRPLPDTIVIDPFISGLDSIRVVVRSPEEWRALWESDEPRYRVPPIDYSREMVLVVAAGERAGHGRTIRIDSAFVHADSIFVSVTEYEGGRTCGTTGMIVTPIHVMRVDALSEPVHFLERGIKERICDWNTG